LVRHLRVWSREVPMETYFFCVPCSVRAQGHVEKVPKHVLPENRKAREQHARDKRQTRLEAATASWTGGCETNWETRLERREKHTRSQSKE